MTGREIDTRSIAYSEVRQGDPPLLQVEKLNLSHGFFDVSFELKPREVLGITGLLGSGRTELALSLFGELPAESGRIRVEGKDVTIRCIEDAIRRGIGYVPEDRIREGLFLEQSISDNIVVRIIDSLLGWLGLVDDRAKQSSTTEWIEKLDIKTPTGENAANTLSGGNQQRLVLAKWLASNPKALILNGPTVGVDVGSKAYIHELIRKVAKEGMGVILISDDIPELLQTCNRILLMRKGRIVNEFRRAEVDEEELNRHLVAGDSGNGGEKE